MKIGISINERIKDLRNNKHMSQKELAIDAGIPISTYGSYELEDYPVPHPVILQLANYYDVSTDYLLGLTDNPETSNTPVSELHLSDAAIQRILDEKTNSRLLSEIVESDAFMQLLIDSEVYVDGYVEESVDQYNTLMEFARKKVTEKYGDTEDTVGATLAHSKVAQHEYFGRLFANDLIEILDEIKENHSHDQETSDGAYTTDQYERIYHAIMDHRSGPLKGLGAGIIEALRIKKTEQNQIAADTLIESDSPGEEAISDLLGQSPIVEPAARKRRRR